MKKFYHAFKFICSIVVMLFAVSTSANNYQKLKIKIVEKEKDSKAQIETSLTENEFSSFQIISDNLNIETGDSVGLVGSFTDDSELKAEDLLNRIGLNPELIESDESLEIFPNPLSTSAKIRYNINKDSKIKLAIYNMFGQQMKLLVDEIQHEGLHITIWDTSDESGVAVPTGIYLCRMLKNGKVSQVKRIVLNR